MNEVDLFRFTSGPHNARVVLVGEAWGANEAQQRRPFVGHSGQELDRMLKEAGLSREAILCTNLVHTQPPSNDFTHFLVSNKEAKAHDQYHGIHPKPILSQGINNLWNLLNHVRPELVIAAGNWPLHILTEHGSPTTKAGYKVPGGISSWRGSQTYSRLPTGGSQWASSHDRLNVLPIVHPAAIIREWGLRHITVHDLRSRAARFLKGELFWDEPEVNDVFRPTFQEVMCSLNQCIAIIQIKKLRLAVDIETVQKRFISCIGLGDDRFALCIPFFYFDQHLVKSYWTLEEELEIWSRLHVLLTSPNLEIVGQNFIYDSLFIKRYSGIDAFVSFDTMVAHHLLYPGTPKGLHYLSSLYCDHHCYWKDESEEWAISSITAEDLWRYNCKDIRRTYECSEVLRSLINRKNYGEALAWRLREWKLSRKMALRGINFNNQLRILMQRDCIEQRNELEKWLLEVVPDYWQRNTTGAAWYDSPKMLAYILYDRLGIIPVLHKKTKRPTCDDTALEELISRKNLSWMAPMLRRIQSLRSLNVFKSHFLDIELGPSGRYNNQWNVAHPETFRWSSSANPLGEGTNTQNIPKVEVD
jgi:uracil-DNA glycosylase family 4